MMKIRYRFIILCLLLYLIAIFFSIHTIILNKRINSIKDYFDNAKLYDMDGKIRLDPIEGKKIETKQKLNELIKEDDYLVFINNLKKENNEAENEIDGLYNNIQELEKKKENVAKEYEVINKKYQAMLAERAKAWEKESKNNLVLINNVPTINQYPKYPTGCESVALTLLLRYYGINVSVDDVIAKLKKGDLPYNEGGIIYGGNPEIEFIGSPYNSYSYGVYNNPIANVANAYKGGVNVKTGLAFESLLNLIRENRPVVAWTSMNLAVPYISSSWIYKPTGEVIKWRANEHAVLVVGFNDYYVVISDPLTGQIRYQSRKTFESRYNYYGARAVYY